MPPSRRGRPTKKILKQLKPLDSAKINALILAVVDAYATRQESIYLVVSYLTEFAPDFPKGIIKKQEGLLDIRLLRANKVLQWLNKHGYFNVTPLQLRGELIAQGLKHKELLG